MPRQIKQISTSMTSHLSKDRRQPGGPEFKTIVRTVALCGDGSVWAINDGKKDWRKLPSIPSDDEIVEAERITERKRLLEVFADGQERPATFKDLSGMAQIVEFEMNINGVEIDGIKSMDEHVFGPEDLDYESLPNDHEYSLISMYRKLKPFVVGLEK